MGNKRTLGMTQAVGRSSHSGVSQPRPIVALGVVLPPCWEVGVLDPRPGSASDPLWTCTVIFVSQFSHLYSGRLDCLVLEAL